MEKSKIYNNSQLILMTLSGAVGGLAVGYDSGIVAGTLLYIDKDFPDITLEEKSVSIIVIRVYISDK